MGSGLETSCRAKGPGLDSQEGHIMCNSNSVREALRIFIGHLVLLGESLHRTKLISV